MTEELKELGFDVGHRCVRPPPLGRSGKAICREGDSGHKFNIAPNLPDRDFAAEQPNQKWAGDISYVWTREGRLYLAIILDLHSRRVVGWAVSNRMKRDPAIRALKALGIMLRIAERAFRSPPKAASITRIADRNTVLMIIRRSCGSMASRCRCQVRAAARTTRLSRHSSKPPSGSCCAYPCRSVIKAELTWRRPWETRRHAEMAIFEYINGFYNPRRRHSALGWKSPVAFKRKVA